MKGLEELSDRDAIFEICIIPPFRGQYEICLRYLIEASEAQFMESQSNDLFTSRLLIDKCQSIVSDVILFEDEAITTFPDQGLTFRKRNPDDVVFGKQEEEDEYVLAMGDRVVVARGFLLH